MSESEVKEYIQRFEKSADLLRELRRDHPSVPEYLAAQMRLFDRIGFLYQRMNDTESAIKVYREAVAAHRSSSADAKTVDTDIPAIEARDDLVDLLLRESRKKPDDQQALLREALASLQDCAALLAGQATDRQVGPPNDPRRIMERLRIDHQMIEIAKQLGDDELLTKLTDQMDRNRRHDTNPVGK